MFVLDQSTVVIGVKCAGVSGSGGGVIASDNQGLVTDQLWQCSDAESQGWLHTNFTAWAQAEIGTGAKPDGLDPRAEWISPAAYGAGDIYCRRQIGRDFLYQYKSV